MFWKTTPTFGGVFSRLLLMIPLLLFSSITTITTTNGQQQSFGCRLFGGGSGCGGGCGYGDCPPAAVAPVVVYGVLLTHYFSHSFIFYLCMSKILLL
jgi:hypothetical protein